ncbi:hypothetical protein A4G28_22670 [Mycobacterium ostraviense]|uniref:Uncharacterized protein n=1 Tax=Mycobacterium ostraviense TaxID=2738409 RepID=A0A162EWD9_9MYCO|nr:hypothetical protein A4G28_22670 [Mycobacterium ostraviense]
MHTALTRAEPAYRDAPVVAALGILYSAELIGLVGAAAFVATGGHERLDRGTTVLAIVLVAAAAVAGWHAIRLLQGARVLKVTGLTLQSATLITAIAVATVRPDPRSARCRRVGRRPGRVGQAGQARTASSHSRPPGRRREHRHFRVDRAGCGSWVRRD